MSNKEQEIKIKISGNVDPSFNKSLSAASAKLEEIGKSTGDTSKSFSDAEKSGVDFGEKSSDAISTLDAVLASAGISAALTGIESAFEECVKAADEYETACHMTDGRAVCCRRAVYNYGGLYLCAGRKNFYL